MGDGKEGEGKAQDNLIFSSPPVMFFYGINMCKRGSAVK